MRILLAVLLVLVCAPADAQVVSLWDPAYVAVRPGASVKVMIIASIRPGYLVAARQPQGRQLQPLSVSLRPAPYLAVGTPIYPAAKMTELDPDQAGLAGHTGTLRIAVPISVSRQAPAGELQLHGELHYQACSPRVCFKPRSLPIRIPIEVQAARTP